MLLVGDHSVRTSVVEDGEFTARESWDWGWRFQLFEFTLPAPQPGTSFPWITQLLWGKKEGWGGGLPGAGLSPGRSSRYPDTLTTAAGQRSQKQAGSLFACLEAIRDPSALSNTTTPEVVENHWSVRCGSSKRGGVGLRVVGRRQASREEEILKTVDEDTSGRRDREALSPLLPETPPGCP